MALARAGSASGKPWRHGDACVIVHFRLRPKSSKDAIDGFAVLAQGPVFQARVRAVPDKGQANLALVRLVSDWLSVPVRDCAIASGATSRLKAIRIAGNVDVLSARLENQLALLGA